MDKFEKEANLAKQARREGLGKKQAAERAAEITDYLESGKNQGIIEFYTVCPTTGDVKGKFNFKK